MLDAAPRAATPAITMLNELRAELLRAFAGLFAVTAPADREQALHRVLLFSVLCLGTVVRFWGLGDPGLHGDEETMAMATMHIVQDGRPILPSGMLYPRGLTELYLMAASVKIFGESEWAFRLPSALCGVAVIGLAFLAGRRFLRPRWNLALAATVALLPDMIEYSQTARMYIFMLACIGACLVCIFEWERSDRHGWLIGAVLALVIGIELHALAVTCALLFLLPAILHADQRKLALGLAAAVVVMVAYLLIDGWQNAQYPVPPPEYAADIVATLRHGGSAVREFPLPFDIALWIAAAATALFAVHFGRVVHDRLISFVATVLMLSALVAQLLLYYHIGAVLALVGVVVTFRYRKQRAWRRFLRYALAAAIVGLIHVTVLAALPGSVIKLAGMLVGQPSVWSYVRIAEFSAVAAVIVAAGSVWGLWRIAKRRPVPDFWLLALLGVWIPMFMLGWFRWNLPSRYTCASLLPMLLCAFAFTQYAVEAWLPRRNLRALKPLQTGALFATIVLVIDPVAANARFGPGHLPLPDHKGAALFMRAQHITPDDVLLAEDVLQQTYYLGSVDYWLISRKHARRFVEQVNGEIRDFYTGTRVIDTGPKLAELLDRSADRRIYVIGSGENRSDDRREMRGDGIGAVLKSNRFEVVYVGRDGYTTVWRARQESAVTNSAHSR